MATENLDLPVVLASQNQKEVTINEGFAKIDALLTEPLTKDFTSASHSLTLAEMRQNAAVVCANVSVAGRTLNLPQIKRLFSIVNNAGAASLDVIRGTTTLTVPAGESFLVYLDGTENGLYAVGGGSSGTPISALDDISDVDATTPNVGDVLTWDGDNWVPQAPVTSWAAVPRTFRGALVQKTGNQSIAGSELTVTWGSADYDTDSIFSGGAPTRLTVPANVTKVRISGNLTLSAEATAAVHSFFINIWRDGSNLSSGRPQQYITHGAGAVGHSLGFCSPVIEVSAAQYFEVRMFQNSGETLDILDSSSTWFAMEIIEVDNAEFNVEDLDDVNLTGLSDGDVLIWDDGTQTWVPGAGGGGGATEMGDLSDVDLSGLTDGDVLVWNNGTGKWEPQAAGAGGSAQTWAAPYRGARVARTTNQAITAGVESAIMWDTEVFDTDGFHSNVTNTNRITIPAGISKVALTASIDTGAVNTTAVRYVMAFFRKNGATGISGDGGNAVGRTDNTSTIIQLTSGTIEVEEGDYFDVAVFFEDSTTVDGVVTSWFEVEVKEVTDAQARPYDIGGFVAGEPTSGALVLQHVAVRAFTLPASATGSRGYAGVDPATQADLDLRKNGVSIGTMRFAAGANTATFVGVSETAFAIGDRFQVVSPSPADADLADISMTFMMEIV